MEIEKMTDEIKVTERFLHALQELKNRGLIKNNKDFARILGVGSSFLSEISSGRCGVSVKMVQKMCSCFGIRSGWMLQGEGSMFDEEQTDEGGQENDSDSSNAFPHRLQEIIDMFCDGKNTVCARMTDSNEANIRGYLNGTVPKLPFLAKCIQTFDIDSRWLLTGEGQMQQEMETDPVMADIDSNPVLATEEQNERESTTRGIANIIYNGKFYQVEIANIITKKMAVL